MDERGINVDSDTLLAIQEGNKEVIKEFKKDLAQTTADIKEYMILHISPLKDDVIRIRDDVADLYNKDRDMRDRVGVLEQRQSSDEGNREGRDTAENNNVTRSELTWGKVAGIGGIIALIFTAVGFFIKQ